MCFTSWGIIEYNQTTKAQVEEDVLATADVQPQVNTSAVASINRKSKQWMEMVQQKRFK